MKVFRVVSLCFFISLLADCLFSQQPNLQEIFQNPQESAKPWVFWYWVKASVSKEGITADLEAMKENGIGGAYLIPVQGAETPPLLKPPVEQLSPEWWQMIEFAFAEAKRLGLRIAMHSCDGFAVAGGPWITPDMSMQKIVWSGLSLKGDKEFHDTIPQPETKEGYYRDIALYAYPTPKGAEFNTNSIVPKVSTSLDSVDAQYLCDPANTEVFKSKEDCWIQFAFESPFTCRTVSIRTTGLNYQSHRLIIESSNNGVNFQPVCQLEPPRHGWQDYEENITHSIPSTTAKYFRFIYNKEGAEPGSEDLDAARWNPALKIRGITLSGEASIHQFEGKNGSMWRLAKTSTSEITPDSLYVPINKMINISQYLDSNSVLRWNIPEGNWTILRIGHTSTGHTNYIGGKGLGLECDKFNPEIVKFQFDQWFGKVFNEIDQKLASEVLKVFHVDSWECGSQNWSVVFRDEFKKRRGYDLYPYLPIMTGLPIESSSVSEGFLYDVRQTIDELITENFFGIMAKEAKTKGCIFSSESVAPVMVSDAMAHYKQVDIPMGEFWFNSPTHDKPTDVLDAISAAHIYGKNIVQSEAFTTLRMDWSETPAMLKTLGDRNFALGVNRFVFHVFTENPWMDRKPGMTLNTVGLYFQRDQTWWKQGKAWICYLSRCQALLQQGRPVVDIAVFTGEEYPRRALTPDRLIGTLPGLYDPLLVEADKIRLENKGVPMNERPYGVSNSSNSFDPSIWTDPLRGYKYDSFNKDALMKASVKNGKIILPDGQTYKLLVIPGKHKMNPNNCMSLEVAEKIQELILAGATVIVDDRPEALPGLTIDKQKQLNIVLDKLWEGSFTSPIDALKLKKLGKGRIIKGPYTISSLVVLGIEKDFVATNSESSPVGDIAWCHRASEKFEFYFISNQEQRQREINVSVRKNGYIPELFDPITGQIVKVLTWEIKDGRTILPLKLEANASIFLVFQKKTKEKSFKKDKNWFAFDTIKKIDSEWVVTFDTAFGGPLKPLEMHALSDWTSINNDSIRYYSGTAVYKTNFTVDISNNETQHFRIDLGEVHDIAEVWINGEYCGTAWTYPYQLEVSHSLKAENELEIRVTNTWKNRIIGDNTVYKDKPITWTTAPFRIEGQPLIKAGLLGPVRIIRDYFKEASLK